MAFDLAGIVYNIAVAARMFELLQGAVSLKIHVQEDSKIPDFLTGRTESSVSSLPPNTNCLLAHNQLQHVCRLKD
ncbi:MAG: hypothetical protein OXD01_09635 [Gammaproteobacteria bacterium]|nr:hypothetical protein [Gammaproteobacteria bacterium]